MGDSGHGTDGVQQANLDTGSYNPVQNLSDTFPGGVLTYTTRDGDSLQGIAGQMYGNSSLWFVLADANGLDPNQPLKAGTTLQIPNTVKTGHITNDNHKVYSESEIVGSTLPNLKSPPPPQPSGGCGSFLMILIIVVIAVVAAAFIGPLAGAILEFAVAGGAAAAGVAATLVAYAVAGAVVAAVASIVQQGLFIALGYQQSFSWKEVGASAVAGALSGAAQGLGAAAKAGKIAADSVQYAKVAAGALQAASVASKQLILNGKITSWTSLAAAAVGAYASVGSQAAAFQANAAKTQEALNAANSAAQAAQTLQTVTNATQWWLRRHPHDHHRGGDRDRRVGVRAGIGGRASGRRRLPRPHRSGGDGRRLRGRGRGDCRHWQHRPARPVHRARLPRQVLLETSRHRRRGRRPERCRPRVWRRP